ncbi:Peptidase M3A/M3B catalytic domain-containing protein [Sphingomonas antarctica]|uniref:M3 family metallopeptidase n=1 Tax=Sphingomonas antarctica TaxID=2040274 RepID=UPI0039E941AF
MRLFAAVLLLSTATPALAASFDTAPRLNPASADEAKANCDQFLNEAVRLRTAFETGKPTGAYATAHEFDEIQRFLDDGGNDAGMLAEIAPDDARRNAGRACQARASDAQDALYLSVPAYKRLKTIDGKRLDAAGQVALTRALGQYDRNGVSRDEATRAKVTALKSRINELGIEFDKAIADGRKTVTAKPEDLAGLPADFIAAHKPGADGLVTISTDYPDLGPVMSYAQNEDLRKRLYFANLTRAYPGNDAILTELFAKRDELAKLLGRPDFATLALEDKMIGTPTKAREFLAQIDTAAKDAATRDFGKMQARYALFNPGGQINPWSTGYVQQLIRKEAYTVDPQEVRQYFAYNNVRDGILQWTRDLFGVEIKPWKTATWDPSVEPYEMYQDGKLIGQFYFDTHPRPGKYNHANVVPIRMGITGRQIPTFALVTNFPAGDHTTGLMEHRDVETFLHEYGHLIHGIFAGQQNWEGANPFNIEWDFVEAPSQMLENWVWDYGTLSKFAVDKNGKTIPKDLVERMNKARYFAEAYGDRRQLGLSNISLGFHSGPPQADLSAEARELDRPYTFMPYPEGTHMQDSFGHLSGYSAFYYTYMWSKAIAVDMYSRFEKDGLRNTKTAAAYRAAVLAPGSSKPAAELVSGFLGRPLSVEAYKARLAKGN